MKKRLLPVILVIALPLIIHTHAFAQDTTTDACNIDLSQLVAGLVESQASIASGNPAPALPVLRAAAEALTIFAERCDAALNPTTVTDATPEATRTVESLSIPGSYHAPNGVFVFDYPPEWTINEFMAVSTSAGAITVGTSQEAIDALNTQQPLLLLGQQAVQIFGGTSELLTSGEITEGTVENMLSYYAGTFSEQYDEVSQPELLTINGRQVGRLLFSGATFDSVLLIMSLDDNARFVIIGGVAAKGERELLLPIVEQIAASMQ